VQYRDAASWTRTLAGFVALMVAPHRTTAAQALAMSAEVPDAPLLALQLTAAAGR
jgi:hypothetical protein